MGKSRYIKTLIITLLAISCLKVYSQSSDCNYVMRVSPLSGSTSIPGAFYDVSLVDVDYYDGLGRQYSHVSVGSSGLLDTLTYDSKGRLLSDRSQGIREISYYPNDLPREILMTNAEKLINTYHSDGSKHSDYRRIRYMKTVMQIDTNGDTVYVKQPAYKTIYRYYVGNSVRENNAPTRFYTEDGYFEYYRGVATFHYYVRDYLGSIRAIVNTDGEIEQTVDYLSTGIPIKGGKGEIIDDRLHTGKQYLSMNGTLLYDNVARYYSPVHGRFITPDALSSTYPHISLYAHCANNPLSIIDPTGNDWVIVNGNIVWQDEVSIEDNTKDEYIGASDADLLKYLGIDYNLKSFNTNLIGMISSDAQIGRYAISHLINVKEKSNIKISLNVVYDINNITKNNKNGVTFNGLTIDAYGSSANSGTDGDVYSISNLSAEYGGSTYSSPLLNTKEDTFSVYGTVPKSGRLNIPVSDVSPLKSLSKITIYGSWNVKKPEGNTPIVIHSFLPIPLTYKHVWNF